MIKRLFIIFFIVCFSAKSFANEKIVLGYIDLYPHIYTNESGVASGPLAILLHGYLAPAMNISFKLVNMPLPRVFKNMDNGSLCGIAIAGFTPERNLKYIYPKLHIYTMQSALLIKETHPLNVITSPSDLTSMKIGYFKGGIETPYIKNNNIQLQNIYGLNAWERNLKLMLRDRIDAMYSPSRLNLMGLIEKRNLQNKTKIITIPEEMIKLYTIFSQQTCNGENDLANRYSIALKKIDGNNLYKKLMTSQ